MGAGYGAAVGGIFEGIGTGLGAYWAAEESAADRKQAREEKNKSTLLKVNQFNMNQDRLAGLGAVLSGDRFRLRQADNKLYGEDNRVKEWQVYQANKNNPAISEADFNSNWDTARANAYASSTERASEAKRNTGDYKRLTASDYQIGAPDSSSKHLFNGGAYSPKALRDRATKSL